MKTFLTTLLLAGILVLLYLIGGTKLLFELPGIELVALAGVAAFFLKERGDRTASVFCILSTVLFIGYVLVRNRLSPVDYIARLQFFNAAGCLITYLLWTLAVDTPRRRKWFFTVLIVLAIAQVGIGLVQFKNGNQWMIQPFTGRRDEWWRASGLYISPNHFAGFLEIVALIALSLAIWGRMRILTRVMVVYAVFCCLVGIAISGSRGGYLSIASGMVVLLILSLGVCHRLQRDRFWLLLVASVVGLVGVLGSALMAMSVSDSIKGRLAVINDTEDIRVLLWEAALDQFQQAPVFGTGGFTYLYYGRLFRDPGVQLDPIHVHGDYLQLLAEYGTVGALLFAVFLGAHLYMGGRGILLLINRAEEEYRVQSDRLALCLGAFSGIAAMMVHSVVDFNMQIPANALIMATLFGILASPLAPATVSTSPRLEVLRRRIYAWFLPGFAALILLSSLPLLPGEWFAEKARIALRDKKPVEALQEAQAGIKFEKNNPDLYYYAGEAARVMANDENLKSMLQPGLAVEYFQIGLQVFPQDSRLHLKLANAWSDSGHYFEARKVLQLAEQWDPNSAYYYSYLGLVELRGGFPEDAHVAFTEALELDSTNILALEGTKTADSILEKRRSKNPIQVIPLEEGVVEETETPPASSTPMEMDIREIIKK